MRIGSGVLGLVFLAFFLEAARVRDAASAGSRLPMNVGKNGSEVNSISRIFQPGKKQKYLRPWKTGCK